VCVLIALTALKRSYKSNCQGRQGDADHKSECEQELHFPSGLRELGTLWGLVFICNLGSSARLQTAGLVLIWEEEGSAGSSGTRKPGDGGR
jgi:hypothetical protein